MVRNKIILEDTTTHLAPLLQLYKKTMKGKATACLKPVDLTDDVKLKAFLLKMTTLDRLTFDINL